VPRTDPQHGKLRVTRDEAVRERIALVLRKEVELGGAMAVVRYLVAAGLSVPVIRGRDVQATPVKNLDKNGPLGCDSERSLKGGS
jgi:hypothetical protein